jgi:hypothetical protein
MWCCGQSVIMLFTDRGKHVSEPGCRSQRGVLCVFLVATVFILQFTEIESSK